MITDRHTSHFTQWQSGYGRVDAEVFYETKRVHIRERGKQIVLDFETAAALVQFLARCVTEGRVER